MKQKYTVTLDEHVVKDIKKRGIALSTMLNQLINDKLFELRKNDEITIEERSEAYARMKENHGDKTIKQLDTLLNFINSSEMEQKKKELTFQALMQLKENKVKAEAGR